MSIVDQVKQSKSPRQAIMVLARAIDELSSQVDGLAAGIRTAKPTDSWDEWMEAEGEDTTYEPDHEAEVAKKEAIARRKEAVYHRIRELEDRLSSEPDDDERSALQAQLQLAKDELRDELFIEGGPAPSASVVEVVNGEVVINLPPASEERKARRRELAEAIQLEESIEGVGIDDYAKGGPLWLYYGNRDYVMGLPHTAHVAMIQDVFEDDPIEAAQMSADLLKFTDTEGPELVLGRLHGDT